MQRTPGKTRIPPTPTSKASQQQEEKGNVVQVAPSKNRHLLILNNLKKREDNWNSRFHLEQIPTYNAAEEGFANKIAPRKNQNFLNKDGKVEFAPGKIRKRAPGDPHTPITVRNERPESVGVNARGKPPRIDVNKNQQFIRKKPTPSQGSSTGANGPETSEYARAQLLLEDLEQKWEEFNVEQHHREIFKFCIKNLPVRRQLEALSKEKEDISKKRAPVQGCQVAIKARETCLRHINEINNDIETIVDSPKLKECIEKSSELLTHIRILSLNVVENIIKWRKYLLDILALSFNYNETMKQAIIISYISNGENYLLKMKKDLNFLSHSSLSNYYRFSNNNDPFLLAPTAEPKSEKDEKLNHFISKNLYQRIRACELVIVEESVSTRMVNKSVKSALSRSNPQNSVNTPSRKPAEHKHSAAGTHAMDSLSAYRDQDDDILNGRIDSKQGSQIDAFYNETPSKKSLGEAEDLEGRTAHKSSPEVKAPSPSQQQQLQQQQQQLRTQNAPQQSERKRASEGSPLDEEPNPQQKKRVQAAGRQSQEQPKKRATQSTEMEQHEQLENSELMGETEQKPDELVIEEGKVYEDELKGYLEGYLKYISNVSRDSFTIDPEVLVSKAEDEQETGVFEFFSKRDKKREKKVGIAIVNVEKSFSQYRRLSIMHLSVVNDEMLEQAVRLLFKFLTDNDCCEEIRVSLYHIEDPETQKLDVNKNLKKCFTDLGFKWKMVTNDSYTNKRNTIFSFRRPPDVSIIRKYPHQPEPISLRSCVLLSESNFSLEKTKELNKKSQNEASNLASISNALKQYTDINHLPEEVEEKNVNDQEANRLIRTLATIKKKGEETVEFPAMRHTIIKSAAQLETFFQDNSFPLPDIKFPDNDSISVACNLLKAYYRWSNFIWASIKVEGVDRSYLRTKPVKEEEFSCIALDNRPPMYVIPTEDDKLRIFVSQACKAKNGLLKFNAFYIKASFLEDADSGSMSLYLEKIFKNDNTSEPFKDDVWIPVFKKELDFHPIDFVEGNFGVQQAVQNLTISTNYPLQNGAVIKGRSPSHKSVILKPPFIFGMIHSDLYEKLEMPLFYALIEKDDCLLPYRDNTLQEKITLLPSKLRGIISVLLKENA